MGQGKRHDDGGYAEDEQQVGHVAAHDVAHGHAGVSRKRRGDAHEDLGHRGADGADREACDAVGHAEALADMRGALDELVAAEDEHGDTEDDQGEIQDHIVVLLSRKGRARSVRDGCDGWRRRDAGAVPMRGIDSEIGTSAERGCRDVHVCLRSLHDFHSTQKQVHIGGFRQLMDVLWAKAPGVADPAAPRAVPKGTYPNGTPNVQPCH